MIGSLVCREQFAAKHLIWLDGNGLLSKLGISVILFVIAIPVPRLKTHHPSKTEPTALDNTHK